MSTQPEQLDFLERSIVLVEDRVESAYNPAALKRLLKAYALERAEILSGAPRAAQYNGGWPQ